MINEELKTFIAKMRAAGKTDPEIVAELKMAGWDEAAIKQELQSKLRLNLGKVKFWIWLYGVAILLSSTLVVFSPITSVIGRIAAAISMIYIFGIVPIVTQLAIGFKLFFWILRFIPRFKYLKLSQQLDHKWLLAIAIVITGAIMLGLGFLAARDPNAELGSLMGFLIAVLGGFLLILSFILAVGLTVGKKIAQRKKTGLETSRSAIAA